MNERCREIADLLSPWRDGELDAERAREVAEHVADCAACQAKVSAWHEAEAALAATVPSRSDLEWERLAQRVEEAIDADELERIAETLPGAETELGAAAMVGARAAEPIEPAAAAARSARGAAPARPHPPGRPLRWWAVGSGLAAAALVVLFWPWFQRPTEVAPGPGALRERVGAAGRIEGTSRDETDLRKGDAEGPTGNEVPAGMSEDRDLARLAEEAPATPAPDLAAARKDERGAKEMRQSSTDAQTREAEASEGSDAPLEDAAPLDHLEALGYLEGGEPANAPAPAPAAEPAPLPAAIIVPTAPPGAVSLRDVAEWAGGGAAPPAATESGRSAAKSLASAESAITPAEALRLAHEAREAGDRERARAGYRLLAGDFDGNTVREKAWYSLIELQTEDVRAGSTLEVAREAAASLEAFRLEYPESLHRRGILASRVFVWARLVELDPRYCDEADERVRDWQEGLETAPLDVLRAVAVIADGCAR